jgi:hypothetical protein
MKPNTIVKLAILPATVLALAACSIGGNQQTTMVTGHKSAAMVDTYTNSATVTHIDATHRKLALKFANGARRTLKCGPEVVNFNQIKVNDRVNVTLVNELAVSIGHGKAPSASATDAVALAPVGAKPGAIMANTVQLTAKVTAINTGTRMVTLKLPDGSSKTLKVDPAVDLAKAKVGDNVTVRHTEAMAITVAKP